MNEPRSTRRRPIALAIALLFALALSGCSFSCSIGTSSTLAGDELAEKIQAAYEEQTGVKVKTISCGETDAEVGAPIECQVTNEPGAELEIGGEVTEVDGSRTDFDWEVTSASLPGEHFGSAAAQVLEERTGHEVGAVNCPERIALEQDSEFRCTVVAPDGSEIGATVTLTDEEGGFNIKVD